MILPRGNQIKDQERWATLSETVVPNICPYYTISTYGRIYNAKTKTFLPQNIFYHKDKYITISLALNDGRHIYQQIHRLLLMTFMPISNPDDYDGNHLDGVKYHNWIWNLEWATHRENMQHAWNNELFKFGSERSNTIYEESTIHHICKLIANGKSASEVSEIFGQDMSKLYYNIKNGHC